MSAASTAMFEARLALGCGAHRPGRLAAARLPEAHHAVQSAPLLPSVAGELGLPGGLPVAVGGMDGPLTQLGAAGTRERTASCTVGTSIAVRAGPLAGPPTRTSGPGVTRSRAISG